MRMTKILSPRLGFGFEMPDLSMAPLAPLQPNFQLAPAPAGNGAAAPAPAPQAGPSMQPAFLFNAQPTGTSAPTPAPSPASVDTPVGTVPTWALVAGGAGLGLLAAFLLFRGA